MATSVLGFPRGSAGNTFLLLELLISNEIENVALDQEWQGEACVWTSVLSTLFEDRAKLILQYRLCHLNDDAW